VALSIVALSLTPLAQLGFKTVGILPAGLPELTLPALRPRDVDGVIPLAFACFLLAYIEGVSAARTLAQKHGYEIDARQELLALGVANAAVAFGQGYPVAGGLSQSTVNDKAGAQTPLALVFASATIALCLLYLTDLLTNLPSVVLAAIVLVAVKGLINVPELLRILRPVVPVLAEIAQVLTHVLPIAFAAILAQLDAIAPRLMAIGAQLLPIRPHLVPIGADLPTVPADRVGRRRRREDHQPDTRKQHSLHHDHSCRHQPALRQNVRPAVSKRDARENRALVSVERPCQATGTRTIVIHD